jgi:hypothetical protein
MFFILTYFYCFFKLILRIYIIQKNMWVIYMLIWRVHTSTSMQPHTRIQLNITPSLQRSISFNIFVWANKIIRKRIYPTQSFRATSSSHVTHPRHHPPKSPRPLQSYTCFIPEPYRNIKANYNSVSQLNLCIQLSIYLPNSSNFYPLNRNIKKHSIK